MACEIRDIAEHRGGLLKKEQHRQLVLWACECAENVLPLLEIQLTNDLLLQLCRR